MSVVKQSARAKQEAEAQYRRRILSPAAFGIHHRIDKELRDYISATFQHSTFFFHEWFLEHPVRIWDDPRQALITPRDVVAPFLSRVVHKTGFLPAIDDQKVRALKKRTGKFDVSRTLYSVPATPENLNLYGADLEVLKFKLENTDLLKKLLDIWRRKNTRAHSKLDAWDRMFSELVGKPPVSLADGVVSVIGILDESYFTQDYLTQVLKLRVNAAKALLREYELVLRPWFHAAPRRSDWGAGLISVSISSDALFWGECVVMLPLSKIDKSDNRIEGVREILVRNVKETFLPIITLLENYFLERQFKSDLEQPRSGTPKISGIDMKWATQNAEALEAIGLGQDASLTRHPIWVGNAGVSSFERQHLFIALLSRCKEHAARGGPWTNSLNELEQALVKLWAARCGLVVGRSPIAAAAAAGGSDLDDRIVRAKESLIFGKYLVASPRILEQVLNVVRLKHGEGGLVRPSIKTALVVGGAGSGKDSMAQLIRLFSPGYRLGKSVTWNMATFRPKEAAVPLLLGLKTSFEGGYGFSLLGLLRQAWLSMKQQKLPPDGSKGLTFIFDELNSLDIDTQGALLRFLENGELLPLGGFESSDRDVDALVIGVMNEDPQTITKMRVLDRVLRDKQVFGGMLGEFLYESFRNQRRLRDDLYFRMIRGGEINLPQLRDRREDIPILFYFTVNNDTETPWEIELSVYEVLMDQSLLWEGNVRELQTVARRIVALASDEYQAARKGTANATHAIRGNHARKALEDHARDSSK